MKTRTDLEITEYYNGYKLMNVLISKGKVDTDKLITSIQTAKNINHYCKGISSRLVYEYLQGHVLYKDEIDKLRKIVRNENRTHDNRGN